MRIQYDPEADVLYLLFGAESEVADSVDVVGEDEGITADLDAHGHVVAIEIVGAKERYGAESVRSVTLEVLEPQPAEAPGSQ